MDANTLVTLIIAGIVGIVFVKDRVKLLFRGTQAIQEENITPQAIQEATPETPLATRTWLNYVNDYPHIAIIGPTKAGKTTLATAILQDRTGQIVVLTGKEGDAWAGLKYVGIDDDLTYTTMQRTFDELYEEIKRRQLSAKRQMLTADTLTIVVDDYSTLVRECPVASNVIKIVARIGRSLNMRLVMLSDSALVKAIGLEGEGETRSNFVFLRLQRGHKGTIEVDGADIPIDTSLVHQLALRANLTSRGWIIPRDRNSELNDLLSISIGGQNLGYNTDIDTSIASGIPDTVALNGSIDEKDAAILAILRANPEVSKNKIYDAIGGNRNTVLARIDELKGHAY